MKKDKKGPIKALCSFLSRLSSVLALLRLSLCFASPDRMEPNKFF